MFVITRACAAAAAGGGGAAGNHQHILFGSVGNDGTTRSSRFGDASDFAWPGFGSGFGFGFAFAFAFVV